MNNKTHYILIEFANDVMLPPEGELEGYTLMPVDIVVFSLKDDNYRGIDTFSECKVKYALYGPKDEGIIARYYKSRFFTNSKEPEAYKEALVPLEIVNTHNDWHWEAAYPQVYSYDKDPAKAEEVNVSVAQNLSTDIDAHVTLMNRGDARGRHFHDGALDSNPLQAALRGANFQEQWNRAFELDPDVVFITGWNEWVAGRIKSQVCETLPVGGFCDQYNLYDSRDAEMSRGPLGDNFYCQLTANIRKFKGMAPLPPASKPKTINLNEIK